MKTKPRYVYYFAKPLLSGWKDNIYRRIVKRNRVEYFNAVSLRWEFAFFTNEVLREAEGYYRCSLECAMLRQPKIK